MKHAVNEDVRIAITADMRAQFVGFVVSSPWLVASLVCGQIGAGLWILAKCWQHPWLLFVGASLVCITVHIGIAVCRGGLAKQLPGITARLRQQSLFELAQSLLKPVAGVFETLSRLAMLLFLDLDYEQRTDLLSGLDPQLRTNVFEKPALELLPLRTLSLGELEQQPKQEQPQFQLCKTDISGLSDIAFNIGKRSGIADPRLQQIITEKVATAAVSAMRQSSNYTGRRLFRSVSRDVSTTVCTAADLAKTLQLQAADRLGHGCSQALVSASDQRLQVTAVSAAGGAVVGGTGGGVAGLLTGGTFGTICGFVPAIFTLGASIPIGTAIGSCVGFCLGAGVGSTAGLISGGAAGYHVAGRQKALVDNQDVSTTDDSGSVASFPEDSSLSDHD